MKPKSLSRIFSTLKAPICVSRHNRIAFKHCTNCSSILASLKYPQYSHARTYITEARHTPAPENTYVTSLRKFFLQVHPDFFEHAKDKQKQNEASFVKINQILDWLSQYRTAPQTTRPIQTPMELGFYVRRTEKYVSTSFVLPPSTPDQPVPLQQAEFAVDRCIHQLLVQAGVELPEGLKDRDFEQEMSEDGTEQPRRASRAAQTKNKRDTLREELRLAVENDLHKRDPSLVKYGWWTEALPEVDAMVEANMLLFHKDISPLQSMDALEKMKMSIQELKFHLWSDIPIIFGKKYDVESMKGVMMVPYNFNKEQFISYVEENADKVRKYAEETLKEVDAFDDRVKYLQKTLDLDLLSITVPAKLANSCISRLKEVVDKGALDKVPLSGCHIIIGEEFYIDMNNACIGIAHDFKDAKELQDFFHFINHDNIIQCAKKNLRDKDVIQEVNKEAAEVQGRLGCVELNIDDQCQVEPALKLRCLRRLRDYCTTLRQLGWDQYRVYLSDEVANVVIHRDSKTAYIPLEFSEGDLFQKASRADKEERAELEGRMLDKDGNIVPEEFADLFKFQSQIETQYKEELNRAQMEKDEEQRRLREIEEEERQVAEQKQKIIRHEFEKEFAHIMEEYELDLEDVLSPEDLAFLRGEEQH